MKPTHISTRRDDWTLAANIYGLLARFWIREIDADVLAQFSDADFRAAWLALGGWIPNAADTEKTREQLAIEFCACFLGPQGHLPPHQSVVSASRFQSDCLSSIGRYVEVIGVPDSELFSGQTMRDHAGQLLAMMQRICLAAKQHDDAELESLRELRSRFFAAHLNWLADYCEVAQRKTNSHFYRGLFEVTRNFLESESEVES